MVPRDEVYRTYWEFAAKRQRAFFARLNGQRRPWSDDPILNSYKFCCTYRASDRVSQYLIRNVIYDGIKRSQEDVVFRILLFKIFNQIGTWEYLSNRLSGISFDNFDLQRYSTLLDEYRAGGHAIYNNAYMSCATKAFGFDQKHRNHLALIELMCHRDHIAGRIVSASSLEEVFTILRSYPLIGDFMAYQLAIDINYSEVIDFSENDFTVVGPGSERGIKKCFVSVGDMTPSEVILWMTENQDQEFRRLGIDFPSLWGRPLHAIDCQGLFCETDKYARVKFPDLKSNRSRIKAKFDPSSAAVSYFYPPKWKINERVGAARPSSATHDEPFRLVA